MGEFRLSTPNSRCGEGFVERDSVRFVRHRAIDELRVAGNKELFGGFLAVVRGMFLPAGSATMPDGRLSNRHTFRLLNPAGDSAFGASRPDLETPPGTALGLPACEFGACPAGCINRST